MSEEQVYTSAEVAKLLKVDPTSVINWSKKGLIECYKTPGGHRRFTVQAVIAFCEKKSYPLPKELSTLDVPKAA